MADHFLEDHDLLDIGILIIDAQKRVISVNKAAYDLLEMKTDEILGKCTRDVFAHYPSLQDLLETTSPVKASSRIQNTSRRNLEVRLSLLTEPESGSCSGQVITLRDMTEYIKVEQHLAQALDFNQKIISSSSAGILAYKASGECVLANQEAARIIKATPEKLRQQNFRELVSWKEGGLLESARAALASGEPRHNIFHFLTTFGREVWMDGTFSTFSSKDETLLLFIFNDITERKKAEMALEENQARLKAIFDNAGVAIALSDTNGNYIQWNQRWEQMLGYNSRELKHLAIKDISHPADMAATYEKLLKINHGEIDSFQLEKRYIRKDGAIFWGNLSVTPIRKPDGSFEALIGVIADITERKLVEEALQESEESFRAIFEQAAVGISINDPAGKFLKVNQKLCDILKYSHDELVNLSIRDVTHAEDAALNLNLVSLMTEGESFAASFTKRFIRKDGIIVWANLSLTRVGKTEQHDEYFISIIEDISASKRAEDAEMKAQKVVGALQQASLSLSSTEEFKKVLELILEQVSQVISIDSAAILLLQDNELVVVSTRGFQDSQRLMGMHIPLNEKHPNSMVVRARRPVRINDVQEEYQSFTVGEEKLIHSWMGIPLIVQDQVIGMLSLDSREVAHFTEEDKRVAEAFAPQVAVALENARLFACIQQLASIDTLTGISNRRHFFNSAEMEYDRCIRYKKPLSAIMMDIDYFKKVNDSYGHSTGDVVLKEIARLSAEELRRVDILGRVGGEEFAILLPETSFRAAKIAAERLRKKIEDAVFPGPVNPIRITVSLGVATVIKGNTSLDMLLDRADRAMYDAKRSGRNRVRAYNKRMIPLV